MDGCDSNLMREHERRITDAENSAESAHNRITEVVALVKDFTVEMRESNKNIGELVSEVKLLTKEITHVVKATEKHEADIAEIKDNMETKDTVLKLYTKIEESNSEYKKGQDAVMTALRQQEKDLNEHKLEPAKEALANQKALKKWLIAGFGSIVLAILTSGALLIIFK